MEYRQVTPPSGLNYDDDFNSLLCPGGSASTNASFLGHDWSPISVKTDGTNVTIPPRSPPKIREIGPALLPRVRSQDQTLDLGPAGSFLGHGRTTSLPANVSPPQFGAYLPARPPGDRRSPSPLGGGDLPTPGSAPLAYDHMMMDSASRRPSISNMRSHSTNNVRTHSRNSSSTSIDASVLGRYGFPTYRQSPTPQPAPNSAGVAMSRTPSAMSHLAPIVMPNGHVQSYPIRRRTASPPANPSRLSAEVEFDPPFDQPTSNIAEYLTSQNPAPSIIQKTSEPSRAQQPYMWFDVRNVVAWSDFSVATMSSIPHLLDLLQINVALSNLPTPGRVNLLPEKPEHLADLFSLFHARKVNAALKVAQGQRHMEMRTLRPAPLGGRQQPEFVSNYQSDTEVTIHGDGRGRVVGIVKCHDQWNSGFRNGKVGDKISYLNGLAQLHHFMREHGCRYGFITTEIELVCVRAGGRPSPESKMPLFGVLEVAEPVRFAVSGRLENGNLQMTAGLALWYLHMLAKEEPLPGQLHWKMDVGAPADLTRQHHLSRDDWMPKLTSSDKRRANTARGWYLPNDPLHRKELGRGRRNRT